MTTRIEPMFLTSLTIALPSSGHNRRPAVPARLWQGWLSGVLSLFVSAGCASSPAPSYRQVATWQLADATPAEPILLGRARIRPDRPLPDHLVQPLCPEYDLISIHTPEDWRSVLAQAELTDPLPGLDFKKGMVVGLMVNVGEAASDIWPIALGEARSLEGQGWLIAHFHRGLYYPVDTAGYLELSYIPLILDVRRIDINNRRFVIYRTDEEP